jgi:hypothetical protein
VLVEESARPAARPQPRSATSPLAASAPARGRHAPPRTRAVPACVSAGAAAARPRVPARSALELAERQGSRGRACHCSSEASGNALDASERGASRRVAGRRGARAGPRAALRVSARSVTTVELT